MNPALNGNGVTLVWYSSLAYGSLIHRSPSGAAEPGFATSWGYSNGNKTFTVHLRPGVRFSDGTTLTAADVVAWIKYYQVHGTFVQNLDVLSSVTATGPLTVVFQLSKPDPLYPYYLDQEGATGTIASAAAMADPAKLTTATYGAGPYMLDTAATIPDSSYVYVRNPYYYDPSAQHWQKIIIKVIADSNAMLASVESGQVQVGIGAATTADAAKSQGVNVDAVLSGTVGVVLFDDGGTGVPLLSNLKVREALNYAIDRPAITTAVFRTYAAPSWQYEASGAAGYVAGLDKLYPYDPAKARSLLAQAHATNLSFTLMVQPGSLGGAVLAQAIAQEWSAVGVKVNIATPTTFGDYVTAIEAKAGAVPATTFQYFYQPLPWELNELFSPTGAYNPYRFQDPSLNSLRLQIEATPPGSAQALKLEQQAMTLSVTQALSVPVSAVDIIMFSAKGVGGIQYSSTFPTPDPSEWYQVK
jgi:peptide/nickel transport system substrate-binding protein